METCQTPCGTRPLLVLPGDAHHAVLQAVATHLLQKAGSPQAAQHIFEQCHANDGVYVQEALHTKFLNCDGLWRRYTETDLQNDLARGYLAIDMYGVAQEWRGQKGWAKTRRCLQEKE